MGCSSGHSTAEVGEAEVTASPDQVQTTWSRLGGDELEEPILNGWVALVHADWLVQLAETGGKLQRRQDLPTEAFVGLEELKAAGSGSITQPRISINWEWLRVIVLSYPWLQPGHPDPHGENLRLVAKALKSFVGDSLHHHESGPVVCPLRYINGGKPYGVLIDFTALFQAPRTEEEDVQFKQALPALNRFYSHPNTVVLKVTSFPEGYPLDPEHPYELPEGSNTVVYGERGWCYAESAMSGLVKDTSKVLDLSKLPATDALGGIIPACMAGREPPLSPDDFNLKLDQKTFTSKKDDFDKVARLYRDAFTERIGRATELNYTALQWGTGQVRQLLQALHGNSTLQSLKLGGNCIGDEAVHFMSQALQHDATLHTLELGNTNIGGEGARALGQALQHNGALQTLMLHTNDIGDVGANALGQALQRNSSLQTLNLGFNNISVGSANALGQALERNNSLQALNLGGNHIGVEGANALGQALQRNNSLQSLRVRANNIGVEGATALGQALQSNSGLQLLDLTDNKLGHGGASALGQALQHNNTLRSLVLMYNDLGAASASALGQALKHNTSLTGLCLYFNNIGSAGAEDLAQALRDNRALKQLDLGCNTIGPEGTQSLAEALSANNCLTALNLGNRIDVGDETSKRVAQEYLRNPELRRELEMKANSIGGEGAKALGQALQRNGSLVTLNVPSREPGEGWSFLQQVAFARALNGGRELVVDAD